MRDKEGIPDETSADRSWLRTWPCSSAAQAATGAAAAAVCSQPRPEFHGQGRAGIVHVWWPPWSLDGTGLRLPPWALAGEELFG